MSKIPPRNVTIVSQDDGATIVEATGDINLAHSPVFHQSLLSIVDRKPLRLVLRLGRVSYLDSSGVGALVDVAKRVSRYSGKLVLVGPNARVKGIFEITRLTRFFNIVETDEEALLA
ncbi:MAG: anti-sigma factor antagonist [Phycisphaerales bacterium]|nr:MAG: anti-sigma factor antagonist [Phycisphaerales bacterium]